MGSNCACLSNWEGSRLTNAAKIGAINSGGLKPRPRFVSLGISVDRFNPGLWLLSS